MLLFFTRHPLLKSSHRHALVAELFPYGEPKMSTLEALKAEMELVSLEECSYHKKLPFPEQYKSVMARVKSTLEHYLDKHPEESVLFVAHGLSVDYLVRSSTLLVARVPGMTDGVGVGEEEGRRGWGSAKGVHVRLMIE